MLLLLLQYLNITFKFHERALIALKIVTYNGKFKTISRFILFKPYYY